MSFDKVVRRYTRKKAHERHQEAQITVKEGNTKEHQPSGCGPRYQKQHSTQPVPTVRMMSKWELQEVSPEPNFHTDSQPIKKTSMMLVTRDKRCQATHVCDTAKCLSSGPEKQTAKANSTV